MYEIQKLNKICNKIEGILECGYCLTDTAENPDGIILRSFNMADFEVGSNLKAIGRAGAGVNNIPIDRMTEKGIVVFNTPGANANAVKELVLCGMLLASRDIVGGNRWVNALPADENVAKATEKGKASFGGTEIFGKTLGVMGIGAIGILVANMGVCLGMDVLAYDPYLTDANRARLDDRVRVVESDEIFAKSDFISLHIPLLPSTRGMINGASLAGMKKGVILLNMSRAELVDVSAVKAAIAEGKVRSYVVDFPTADVLNEKGIIVIPHLGASSEEAEENCATMAAAQLKDYLENGNITNSVNFPSLSKQKTGSVRTCVLYNVGNSVAETLTKKLENADIAYKENAKTGYMIIDGEKELDCSLFKLDGILRVIRL